MLISSIDINNSLNCQDFTDGYVPQQLFFLSHYFIAKGTFWKTWAHYISSALATEAQDETVQSLLNEPCRYPDRDGSTLI